MSKIRDNIITANTTHANDFGNKGDFSARPRSQFAILTRMDARVDPAKYASLQESEPVKPEIDMDWPIGIP